jgi:predicted Zn finger-like uncharacterized protein
MPLNVDCPSCNRKLRVPDELLGKQVKCPTCGTTFTAGDAVPPPPTEVEAPPPRRRPSPPPEDDYDDEDDEPRRSSRRRRSGRYLQPHRGPLILVLGILSLVTGTAPILGPIAWILGNNDLKEIRAGRMDPEGESATQAGRICGMIATIMAIVSLVITLFCCAGYFIIVMAAVAGGAAGAGGGGGGPPF